MFLSVDLRLADRYYYCKASGGHVVQTTISTKYQIVIPSEVRKRLRLKPRQKLIVLEKGGVLYLIPEGPLTDLRGVAPMVPVGGFREKEDRY
jgi:AbrB family looped-hinge helix DNA binding protein